MQAEAIIHLLLKIISIYLYTQEMHKGTYVCKLISNLLPREKFSLVFHVLLLWPDRISQKAG